jgi:hypothetical protein
LAEVSQGTSILRIQKDTTVPGEKEIGYSCIFSFFLLLLCDSNNDVFYVVFNELFNEKKELGKIFKGGFPITFAEAVI